MTITESIGRALLARTSRRGFMARATVTATALSVAPTDFLLKPGTAYAAICNCAPGYECDCSDLCCDGYTQFCCTINDGRNACPPGTFSGGWWKADGSAYCSGPRYYIDCHGTCSCGCAEGSFCPGCDGLTCECALGNCANRHVGCTEFRYGQCHQSIACVGRIACRVVSCIPPWQLDPTCTTTAQTDDTTADHYAPCQDGPMFNGPLFVGMSAIPTLGNGYWLVDENGTVHAFEYATNYGDLTGKRLAAPIVGISTTPTGKGYWLVGADGGVFNFGDAKFYGSTGAIKLAEPVVGISADFLTSGYRMVASDGGVFDFDAQFEGSTGGIRLNKPVVGMAATPTGKGYWLSASDGGIFNFGDAAFYGSLGDVHLNAPIVGIAGHPSGKGYWMVGSDGGVFNFGAAAFHGSTGNEFLIAPIVGICSSGSGKGYWLLGENGAVYAFGDAGYYGGATTS
jgi:hypothetical protein